MNPLTDRELDVLRELCKDGATDREIAQRVFISYKTVKVHISHLMTKLGVHNRTALAIEGRGLVGIPIPNVVIIHTICPNCAHPFPVLEALDEALKKMMRGEKLIGPDEELPPVDEADFGTHPDDSWAEIDGEEDP